ncbi:hypothetical protein EON65_44730 [archaeon]|nr:MAG: hypothetical protein EON65_44730 [archaeon]
MIYAHYLFIVFLFQFHPHYLHTLLSVTIINHQDEVLAMMHPNFRTIAGDQLEKMHINIIPHDRVVFYENQVIRLESNKEIPCDFYIPAFATGGNANFLPQGSKDVRGYAIVDETLAVQGLRHVFAVGDCSNYDRVKTYPKIDDQLPVLKHNLDAILAKVL